MAARTEDSKSDQLDSTFFVTVTKSAIRKTWATPSMANKALATGDSSAASALAKVLYPVSIAWQLSVYFMAFSFGVLDGVI